MKAPTLEGRLFGLRIPAHTNLGCLAMFMGTIFHFFLSGAFLVLLAQASVAEEGPYWFVTTLVAASFVTGILVGIICRERRGLYALLTALFYPVLLPPPMLLGYFLMGILDGVYIHSFLIAAILCLAAAYLGGKAWETLLNSLKSP
jgi:hypothetical protein